VSGGVVYISELIADLVRLRDTHGDPPVAVHGETCDRVLDPTAVQVNNDGDVGLPEIWITVCD
jgi:hypothetical protein